MRFAFSSSAALSFAAFFITAAPVPKDLKAPISSANADRVRAIKIFDTDVFKIVVGPAAGELTLVRWEKPVEVVDDVSFRTIRTAIDGKPIHFAATAKGDRYASCENATKVTLTPTTGGKAIVFDTGVRQPKMTFSPDGQLLFSAGKLWDTSGKSVRELDVDTGSGLTPAFSPDGKFIAVGNRNNTTRLFETSTGKLLHNLPQKMSQELAFSPDGKVLAVAYVDGSIVLWNVATGELKHSAATGAQEVYTLDWSPSGDVLVTAGRLGKIVLWDAQKLKPLKELDAPEWVICVRFSKDGCRLFTAGGSEDSGKGDRKLTAWEVRNASDK